MATRRRFTAGRAAAIGVTLAWTAAGCTSYPSAPADPAYDTDVRPIFLAHCTRCHGDGAADGGSLNVARAPTGPDAGVLPSIGTAAGPFLALRCYLNRYPATIGDCTPDGGSISASCRHGAAFWASNGLNSALYVTIHGTTPPFEMPPTPAPRLDDWELQVIDDWIQNPICSRSSSPDPTICPAGS